MTNCAFVCLTPHKAKNYAGSSLACGHKEGTYHCKSSEHNLGFEKRLIDMNTYTVVKTTYTKNTYITTVEAVKRRSNRICRGNAAGRSTRS